MMMTDELRAQLIQAREAAQGGDITETVRRLDEVIKQIQPDRLLTSTEAAELLGIRSSNTILAWCRTGYLHGVKRGGRMMIPLSEVERIREGDNVKSARALEALHAQTAALGADEGLSDDEMELLHESRPGTLPWERKEPGCPAQDQP
jgi:excisionase family DNA binding protein